MGCNPIIFRFRNSLCVVSVFCGNERKKKRWESALIKLLQFHEFIAFRVLGLSKGSVTGELEKGGGGGRKRKCGQRRSWRNSIKMSSFRVKFINRRRFQRRTLIRSPSRLERFDNPRNMIHLGRTRCRLKPDLFIVLNYFTGSGAPSRPSTLHNTETVPESLSRGGLAGPWSISWDGIGCGSAFWSQRKVFSYFNQS